jgi:L-amino acid N-acyltransferase YncA
MGNQIHVITETDSPKIRYACSEILVDQHYHTAWGDGSIRIFERWLQKIEQHEIVPFLWTYDGQPGGLHWAHDFGEDEQGAYTWVGGTVLRQFRGKKWHKLQKGGWNAVRQQMEARGYWRMFAACLPHNKAGQILTGQTCGYACAGVYRDWLLYRGKLTDCVLYTQRPQDEKYLWLLAEKRAEEARRIYRQKTEAECMRRERDVVRKYIESHLQLLADSEPAAFVTS